VMPGLALAAVLVACGSDGESPSLASGVDIDFVMPSTTPLAAAPEEAPAEQSEEPLDPREGRAAEISGSFSLRIPAIDVSAPVVSIKSNADRVLVPPRDPTIVGWWSDGVAPGSPIGSAVLVGHTVRVGGGVFNDVGSLSAGDTIDVEGSDATLTYEVRSVDVLSKDELASRAEEIFNQSGPGRLVIITCEDWDGTAWRSNIVTIATPA
jgi:LPXTG-site transpeptidase (sortase) family protein